MRYRNFFLRYKIYGTPEEIETDTNWSAPFEFDINHTMIIPINKL